MAELSINTGDITAALQKNLSGFSPSLEATQVGRVLEVGDGIARVSGLPDVGVNELLEFVGGTVGLALNLDEDSIGAVILGDGEAAAAVEEGTPVRATGKDVDIVVVVDPSVLGGIVTQIGDTVIDGSVRHRLAQLRESF